MTACPSRIAAACDCRTWCRDATALDRLDPIPATESWFPAYPEPDPVDDPILIGETRG